jgi:hypothetical protein
MTFFALINLQLYVVIMQWLHLLLSTKGVCMFRERERTLKGSNIMDQKNQPSNKLNACEQTQIDDS